MGVRGLSTFVDQNHKLLTEHKLHGCKVIIDGNNLFYFLFHHYHISHQYGGDIDRYARKCKLFFNTLKQCQVEPYIVFDGGYDPDDRKLPTILTRMVDRRKSVGTLCATGRGTVLPILVMETFRQVLVEMEIPHISCQFEADREIAVLAKRWKCPVMSNDSDFFVYDLEGGFVPFDYVNMTLCVYDTSSKEAKVLDFGTTLNKSQYVYIPVKLYLASRFTLKYPCNIQKIVLPFFATLLGNDYVDISKLSTFYSRVSVPKSPVKKFKVAKTNTRFMTVLHWLETLENEAEGLLDIYKRNQKESRDELNELLAQSVEDYKNLDQFCSLDLQAFFESKKMEHTLETFTDLKDFEGSKLPTWLIHGLRKCEISTFIQNAVVLHRVILLCQVEVLKEKSTYQCSRGIRAIIYGFLMKPQADEFSNESRQNHVVEYDRELKNTKKFYVKPVHDIPGVPSLPCLYSIDGVSKEDKINMILSILDVSKLHNESGSESSISSIVLVGIYAYWINNSSPKVTEHHLSSLILCVILLHARTLKWIDQKRELGGNPVQPFLHEDLVTAYQNTPEKQVSHFIKSMDKYFTQPQHSGRHPRDNQVVHGFSQFQACLLDLIHLNQLLEYPFQPASPSLIFNGTLVYNLCRDIQTRSSPESFIISLTGHGSPLYSTFCKLSAQVRSIIQGDNFSNSAPGKTRRSRNKKTIKEEESYEHVTDTSSESDEKSPRVEKKPKFEANCDINNKFAVLDLDED